MRNILFTYSTSYHFKRIQSGGTLHTAVKKIYHPLIRMYQIDLFAQLLKNQHRKWQH
jgi:hypothetical protein